MDYSDYLHLDEVLGALVGNKRAAMLDQRRELHAALAIVERD